MFDIVRYIRTMRKMFSKQDILIIGGLLTAFFVTRLINLDQFPIFSDEGIYIRWSKVAWKDATWRFISLTDGRQPLQTWATIPFLKIFESNALLAGRLFSVSTGVFALVGMFITALYLFGKKAAYIATSLYIFTPYFLFYDRIALVDSGINAFTIWIFFLSIVLARTLRLDVAIILGLLSGFALLGKSSMRLYIAFTALSGIFILYSHKDGGVIGMLMSFKKKLFGNKKNITALISFASLYFVVVAISFLIYNVQRLSPFFHFVSEKNKTFILTLPELIQSPFAYFKSNIINLPYYVASEMGFVVAILGIIGLFYLYKKDRILSLYFSFWLVCAWFLISLVARVLFPRYVLSLGGLLILPAAFYIASIKDMKKALGIGAIIVLSVAYFNYTIVFDYKNIPFPRIDRGQYIEAWPAGWGAKEIVEFSREKSQEKPVILMAEGNFGMAGDVLDTFLKPGDAIKIQGLWPLNSEHLIENQTLLKENYVYIVFSHRSEFPDEWPMKLVQKYEKPGNQSALYLFELTN